MPQAASLLTPPQLARRWNVGHSKILSFIATGELRAIDLSAPGCTRPRYHIRLADVARFERGRAVVPEAK